MENYNPFSLAGKTVFVTGASSGIGRAVAIECAQMGATLVITGRNAQRLNDTFEQLDGDGHMQFIADINSLKGIDEVVSVLPKLDGVVHCAGIAKILPFQFVNQQELGEVMNVNFVAPTLITAELVKSKRINKGGSIVFISSVSGVVISYYGSSPYSASKGAVNGIVKGMALDLAAKGIRVNSVNPAMIDTNMNAPEIISDEQFEVDKKHYPLKRYGKPEEVAYAVIYLLSDASVWVTGSNILIDGGFTLR